MNSHLPPAHLKTPFDDVSLNRSMQNHDLRDLLQFTRQLRLAGYRVGLHSLTRGLLDEGCAWIEDSCGQPVLVGLPQGRPPGYPLAAPPRLAA